MKGLVIPIAALIAAIFQQWFGVEIEQEAIETTINTILILVASVGMYFGRGKKNKDVER